MTLTPRSLTAKARGRNGEELPSSVAAEPSNLRIGLLGAGAALLGSVIGGIFTLQTTRMSYEHEREADLSAKRADAYFSFHDAARSVYNSYNGISLPDQDSAPTMLSLSTRVSTYGSPEGFQVSVEVIQGFNHALAVGPEKANAWDQFDDALSDLRLVMQTELGDYDESLLP